MIILDTNVVSELVKLAPAERVLRWLRLEPRGSVFVTAVTEAEIFYGIEVLPLGKRRQSLLDVLEKVFEDKFTGHILPFDSECARLCAKIVATRTAAGRPISQLDSMIAAIARAHRAVLATRNTSDFELCEVSLVNPWDF